jgi:hypothetical protein
MTMLKLKSSILPLSAPVDSVRVASMTCPGAIDAPSLFHDNVMIEVASVGFQSDVSKLRFSVVLPVFFM